MTVQVETLTGTLDFTSLEFWAEGIEPGDLGTGNLWGDGRLNDEIAVTGNRFTQVGGDVGLVSGGFLGMSMRPQVAL